MENLFLRFFIVSLAVSVLLLPLLLLREKLERRYAPQTRWGLWLVIALVLLIAPWVPKSQAPVVVTAPSYQVSLPAPKPQMPVGSQGQSIAPIGNQAQPIPEQQGQKPGQPAAPVNGQDQTVASVQDPGQGAVQPAVPAVDRPEIGSATPAVPAAKTDSSTVSLTVIVSALWLCGMAAVLLWQGGGYILLRRRLLKGAQPVEGLEHYALELELMEVDFYQCQNISGPMTLGLVEPVVLLPEDGAAPAALRHELYHIKRHDVTYKTLLLLTCAVHWFNPLVWLMARRADRDVEACCDAAVVAHQDVEYKRAYGELLLASAAGEKITPFATHFGGGKEQMKSRLTQLFRPGKKSKALICVLLAVAMILSSLVACQKASTESLADGIYCVAARDIFWPVGEPDAEGEDYGSIRLTLCTYDEEKGPGEELGEYTLPFGEKLRLRDGDDPGQKGTAGWQQAVEYCLHWPYYRSSMPLGDDYLLVEVKGGQVVSLAWTLIDKETVNVAPQPISRPLTANTMPDLDYYDPETGFLVYHTRSTLYFHYGDSWEAFYTDTAGGARVLTLVRVSADGKAVYFEDCLAEGGEDLRFYRYDVESRKTVSIGERLEGKSEAELAKVTNVTGEELMNSGFRKTADLRSNALKAADGTVVALTLDSNLGEGTLPYLCFTWAEPGEYSQTRFLTPELIPAPRDYTDPDWGFTLHLPESMEGQYVVSKSANWWGFYDKSQMGSGDGFLLSLAVDDVPRSHPMKEAIFEKVKDGIRFRLQSWPIEEVAEDAANYRSMLEDILLMKADDLDLSGVTRSSGYLWPLPYTDYGSDTILRPYEEGGYNVMDIYAADTITVQCAADGVVVQTEGSADGMCGIIVDQGDGSFAMYEHLAYANVKTGEPVIRGMILGMAAEENGRCWLSFGRWEGENWLSDAHAVDPFGDPAADPITYRTYDFQTVSRDTVTIAGDPAITAALREVLRGEAGFWDVESQKWRSVNTLSEDEVSVTVKQYATVDMDNDTIPEVVLWLSRGGNDYSMGSIVLRYKKGLIYGYPMVYRGMNLETLKTDGTFNWSGGAFHYGTGRLDFRTGETVDIIEVDALNADYEAKYFVNGYAATQSEWEKANLTQERKKDAYWYLWENAGEYRTLPPWNESSTAVEYITVRGIPLEMSFADLPQSLRDSLVKGKGEDLTGEGAGLWTTYTGPGIEIVTSQVDPNGKLAEGAQEELGKENVAIVRVTSPDYPIRGGGLKVGDSVERMRYLGYFVDEAETKGGARVAIWTLVATLENGVVTQIEVSDGLRWLGELFY